MLQSVYYSQLKILSIEFIIIFFFNKYLIFYTGSGSASTQPSPGGGTPIAGSTGTLSGKKRAAPLPPPTSAYGTLPSNHHNRTPSDPSAGYHTLNTLNAHKRSPSSDSGGGRGLPHLRKQTLFPYLNY